MEKNIIVVVLYIAVVCIFGFISKKSTSAKECKRTKKNGLLADLLHNEGYLSDDDYDMFDTMNRLQQEQFINECMNRLSAEQAAFMHDEAMKMGIGIEFGGYNPDPNLNPTMNFTHDMMDTSFTHDFGSFDSGGGFNDFGGMF